MRDCKEFAQEVLGRMESIKRKEQARKQMVAFVSVACAGLVLIIGLAFAMPPIYSRATEQAASSAVSATLFAGGAVGGYILIAIVAFMLGATLMSFCMKMRK